MHSVKYGSRLAP